jgi:hypothetical protein
MLELTARFGAGEAQRQLTSLYVEENAKVQEMVIRQRITYRRSGSWAHPYSARECSLRMGGGNDVDYHQLKLIIQFHPASTLTHCFVADPSVLLLLLLLRYAISINATQSARTTGTAEMRKKLNRGFQSTATWHGKHCSASSRRM